MTEIVLETVEDMAGRESLLDLCFGDARFEKASERLREGRLPAEGLSFCAHGPDGRVAATVRLWHVGAGPGKPALLLGPLAVHPWFRARGLGAALMRHALGAAAAKGHQAVLLVGDAPYYRRFGFRKLEGVEMPPPTNPERVLGLALKPGAWKGVAGPVGKARIDEA